MKYVRLKIRYQGEAGQIKGHLIVRRDQLITKTTKPIWEGREGAKIELKR